MKLFGRSSASHEECCKQFAEQFGYNCPADMKHFHATVAPEDRDWLQLADITDILEEKGRSPRIPPGFVPISSEANGDWYCLYRLWTDADGRVPVVLWLRETGTFVPVASDFRSFIVWKCFREALEVSAEERPLAQKRLGRIRMASGIDAIYVKDRFTILQWNEVMLRADRTNAFQLCVAGWRKAKNCYFQPALREIEAASESLPNFGGAYFVAARVHSLRGHLKAAIQSYWRFLMCPAGGSGYTYWTEWGDLDVPLGAEKPAAQFITQAETETDRALLQDPKIRYLTTGEPGDARFRLKLAQQMAASGNFRRALVELENAFLYAGRDEVLLQEVLLRLKEQYTRFGQWPEAQQCDRMRALLKPA